MKPKTIISCCFLIVIFAAWGFALKGNYVNILMALQKADKGWFVISLSWLAVSYFGAICNWRSLLLLVKKRFPLRSACRIWLLSNLAKYLPGTVWLPLSRGLYGKDEELSYAESVIFWAVEICFQLFSAAFVVVALRYFSFSFQYFCGVALLIGFTAGLLFNFNWLARKILQSKLILRLQLIRGHVQAFNGVLAQFKQESLVLLFLRYVLFWLYMGGWLASLSYCVSGQSVGTIFFFTWSWALAWMVGYAVVFMPGGIGVRESVLVPLLVARGLSLEASVLISLLSRVQYVILDGLLVLPFISRVKDDFQKHFLVFKQTLGLKRFRLIAKYFGKPDKVLDVGCGTGHNLIALSGAFTWGVGVDVSASRLAVARDFIRDHEIENIEFKQISGLGLPFKDESFDLVVCTEVLEHVEDDDRLLDDLLRVMRPSGRLLLSVPADEQFTFVNRCLVRKVGDNDHIRPGYSIETLQQKLIDRNLSVSYWGYFGQFFSSAIHYLVSLFGTARQISVESVNKGGWLMFFYKTIFPLIYMFCLLDSFVPRKTKGGFLFVVAKVKKDLK